jgi:hypothetical protein
VRRTVVGLVLLAGAAAAVTVVRDRATDDAAPSTTVPVLEAATVSTGDLSTTESIDGTLTETGSITVVHRIEGQTSSSTGTGTSTSAAGASPAGGNSTGAATAPIAAATESLADTGAEAATTCGADDPSVTTTGAGSVPVDPSASTTSTTTSTTVSVVPDPTTTIADPSASSTDAPSTTVCTAPDPAAVTTTVVVQPTATSQPTDTTVATAATPTGGAPSGAGGSGAAPTGASGSSTGSSAGSTTGASSSRITQLVTWVAPVGAAIASGDPLYSIEGAPVTAMYGDLPAWRTLTADSDDGTDVLQLESNLRALGFDPDAAMAIDRTYDDDTAAAVERWQAALGVEVTGEVALGSVVFVPTATTVTSVGQHIGDEVGDGDSVVTLAGTTQEVIITVPTEDQPFVEPGTTVTVADTEATVTALRSAESNGSVTVQAVIVPSEPLDAVDGSAVKVRLSIEQATGVLLVPADALLSRLDGTYVVQTGADADHHEFVTVQLLGVSNGKAGIRGDGLADGTTVWVPA